MSSLNDIEEFIESFKKRPLWTIFAIIIIVVVISITAYVTNYIGEKGKQQALPPRERSTIGKENRISEPKQIPTLPPSQEKNKVTLPETLKLSSKKGPIEVAKTKKSNSNQVMQPSINQTMNNSPGGIQAGGNVTINGIPKRDIKNSVDTISKELIKYPTAAYRLHYSTNDQEATELANEIDQILIKAKWRRIDPVQRIGGPSFPKGVSIFMLNPPVEPFLNSINCCSPLWAIRVFKVRY